MKKIIWFFIFVASVFSVKAQQYTEIQLDSVCNSACLLFQTEKYQESLDAFLLCMQETKKYQNEISELRYKNCALFAAICYGYLGSYGSAVKLYDDLLSGDLTLEERKDIIQQYSFLCYCWGMSLMSKDNRDLDKARAVFQTGLKYAEGELKTKSIHKIGIAWFFDGAEKQMKDQNDEAYSCYEKALAAFKEIDDKKEELSALRQMGALQKRMLNSEKALEFYDEMVTVSKEVNDTVTWVEANQQKRELYTVLEDWDKAFSLSLGIDSLIKGTQNIELQLSRYYEQGDTAWKQWSNFLLAEKYYKQNLKLIPLLQGNKRDEEAYMTYSRLRDLEVQLEQYMLALDYSTKSIEYYQKNFEKASSKYFLPYLSHAEIYKKMGDKKNAFSCLDSVFTGQKWSSLSLKELARLYAARGMMYSYFKEYDAALKDFNYSDSLLNQKYPENDRSRINYLALKAGIFYQQKKYAVSKQFYTRYAELCWQEYGEYSMEYANALYYLANIDGLNGKKQTGCDNYSQAARILKNLIGKRLRYLPANARETYWNNLSNMLLGMSAYSIKIGSSGESFTKEAYNALLFSKGLLLESEKSMSLLLKQNGTEEDEEEYRTMMVLRSFLPDLEKKYDEKQDSISLVYAQLDRIDKKLAKHCLSYGNYTEFLNLNYKDIRNNLAKNEVIVDFTDYKSDSETHQYMAYVVRKEWENPLLLPLFDQQQIDSLLQANGGHWDRLYQSSVSDAFLQMCWKPISKYVSTGETIYYIPSGILHQVVLESLPASSEALLGDKFRFIRLSSAREIVSQNEVKPSEKKSAALYGGLLYDVDMAVMEMESKKYDVSKLYALRGNEVHGDSVFHYLPMTRKEVDEIGKVLAGCHVDTVSYTGHTGTKESFINLNGNAPQIIHLATHGFYYTPNDALNIEPLSGYKNAMKLSGLIMAGGNAAWAGKRLPPGVLDGILTADDIARMDLNGTELVVLSACETGLGKVTSEGLFGLQRAFKKAGVQTLVMSLWKVSDWITKEFMLQFYKNLAANGWEKRKAFEDAKSSIRKTYEEPFYWAGFVMLD